MLVDDLGMPLTHEEITRRKALGMAGAGALCVACTGTMITAVRYLSPNVLYETSSRLKVGAPSSIAPGSVVTFPREKVFVVHATEGFIALSATCTHLGCMTRYEADRARIFCPCHGSQFSPEGTVLAGPAPTPLPRLEIALESGLLIVDTKKLVDPDFVLRV